MVASVAVKRHGRHDARIIHSGPVCLRLIRTVECHTLEYTRREPGCCQSDWVVYGREKEKGESSK